MGISDNCVLILQYLGEGEADEFRIAAGPILSMVKWYVFAKNIANEFKQILENVTKTVVLILGL